MILEKFKYSVVFAPPQDGIDYVDRLKSELYSKINWYNSRNSKAHVTVIEFTADEDELEEVKYALKRIASHENPVHLRFDGVDSYPNGAFFLKPDEQTRAPLTQLMARIQKKLSLKNSYKSKDPHISIGRKLSEENVQIALQMFADAKLEFTCENLVLRKFNPGKKQYDKHSDDFRFLGLPPEPDAQQSLF